MPLPSLRSPLGRAVVPVLGGIAVLAALAGLLWLFAAYISSGGGTTSERLAPSTFTVGPVDRLADTVAESGPLLFPELGTSIGTRSIVVDHAGDVDADGWRIYWAYPADRDPSCTVEQIAGSARYVDCDGREIGVADLAPPDAGVVPVVENRTTLVIDLRGATSP